MASRAWLESSLQRSASLGLEVLERASRRSVDWTSTDASQTRATDQDAKIYVKRARTELDDAFAAIAECMAEMTCHCKRFYESGYCTDPTDNERSHVSRFHSRQAAGKMTSSTRKHAHVSAADEDFYIEVSPGTYAITAGMQESQQQTKVVNVRAGESISITFKL